VQKSDKPNRADSLRGDFCDFEWRFATMIFQTPLLTGEFLKRYKRFFADVRIGDDVLTVHVPNTGSLKSCLYEGSRCAYSPSNDPNRKLRGTLQFLKTPTSWVGVNTALPPVLLLEAWEKKLIPHLNQYGFAKKEIKTSVETRLDLVFAPVESQILDKGKLHFVEMKNVTLAEGPTAMFPDAVTARGQKHLRELVRLKKKGFGAELVFVVQREDCSQLAPADGIDPEYGKLLRLAIDSGVQVNTYSCKIDPVRGLELNPKPLELKL
jgi:sugar fermentation stimulation protein A